MLNPWPWATTRRVPGAHATLHVGGKNNCPFRFNHLTFGNIIAWVKTPRQMAQWCVKTRTVARLGTLRVYSDSYAEV